MSESPLRQQIAEAIGQNMGLRKSPAEIADAVVALLNLTEETLDQSRLHNQAPGLHRYVTPWLPTTPPDTSSSERPT